MNKELYEQFYSRLQYNQRLNSNNQNPIEVDSSSYPYHHDSAATLRSYTHNLQYNSYNHNGNNYNNYPFQDEVKLEKNFEPNNYCMQEPNSYQTAQNFKENSMTPPPSLPINKPDSSSKYNFDSCQQFSFSPEPADNFLLQSPPKTPYSLPHISPNNEKKSVHSDSKDYNDSPTLRSLLTSGKKQLELSSTIFPTIDKNSINTSAQNYFEKPEYFEPSNFASELNNISRSSTPPVVVGAAKLDKGEIERETNTVSVASLPENMVVTNMGYSPTKSSPDVSKMATEHASVFPWMKSGSGEFIYFIIRSSFYNAMYIAYLQIHSLLVRNEAGKHTLDFKLWN